jgi:hypothetical protein
MQKQHRLTSQAEMAASKMMFVFLQESMVMVFTLLVMMIVAPSHPEMYTSWSAAALSMVIGSFVTWFSTYQRFFTSSSLGGFLAATGFAAAMPDTAPPLAVATGTVDDTGPPRPLDFMSFVT